MTPADFRAALVRRWGRGRPAVHYWIYASRELALSEQTIRAMWYGRRKVTARTEKQLTDLMEKMR